MNFFTRRMLVLALLIALFPLAATLRAAPGEVFYNDWTVTVDELGNAKFVMKFKYDALQYQVWQQRYGNNPALLKRDLSKFVTPYEITDWDVKKNEMEREIAIHLTAKGYMGCKAEGVWQTEIAKNYRRGDRVNNTYTFNGSSKMEDGRVMQASIRLICPPAATDYRERTNEQGDTLIEYKLSPNAIPAPAHAAHPAHAAAAHGAAVAHGTAAAGFPRWIWFASAGGSGFFGLVFLVVGLLLRAKPPVPAAAAVPPTPVSVQLGQQAQPK